MGETIGDAAAPRAKPTILVPPRGLIFASGSGPGFSPGPMTLVSSLFPEQGAFSFSQLLAGAMASPLAAAQPQLEGVSRPLFVVPPGLGSTGSLNSPGYLSPLQSPFGMSHQQALAHVTAQASLSQSFKQMQAEFFNQSSSKDSANMSKTPQTNPLPSEPDTPKLESSEISQSDKKTGHGVGDKPTSDGYNWRKYGQKHVKASEFPRSYYKCSHLNCPVKKKVERSLDGRVSEITYKGEHNHDPPNKANKRGKDSNVLDMTNITSQCHSETDRLKEALPVHSESADFETNTKDSSDHYDKEDTAIIVENGDDDEPNAKRRSLDTGPSVTATSHKSLSESKIVLQTRSQVDLLDDGYKWRKYGQKVVKGNPYPRSYYRCTYSGCNVRKHVERASADPSAVITTYEGKHNHDIPSQQSKTQKTVSKNPSLDKETDFGKNDHVPMTLQLKEQIVA